MRSYWISLILGYLGALIVGTFEYGCATSFASVFVVVGLVAAHTVDGLSVACLGPQSWRDDIQRAKLGHATLALSGVTVGAVPILCSFVCFGASLSALLASKPRMFGGVVLFFFGVPVASWITIYVLANVARRRLDTDLPPGFDYDPGRREWTS